MSLDEDETRALLQDVPAAYRTQINDVLLAALAQALTGVDGRPGAWRSRWRATAAKTCSRAWTCRAPWAGSPRSSPCVLPAPAGGPGDALKRVKEQLRDVPTRGVGYGVLRHLCPDADVRERLAALPAPEVAFNYLGQFDSTINDEAMFAPAPDPARAGPRQHGAPRAPHRDQRQRARRAAGAGVELLHRVHATETVQRLADAYAAALRALIEHCLSPQAGGYTPSDFAAAGLSQEELDDLMAELSET